MERRGRDGASSFQFSVFSFKWARGEGRGAQKSAAGVWGDCRRRWETRAGRIEWKNRSFSPSQGLVVHNVHDVLGLGGLSEDVQTGTAEGHGADVGAASGFQTGDFHAVVIEADDDFTTAPGAAALELTSDVSVPGGRPADGDWVFKDQRHDGRARVRLTGGEHPVVFSGHEGLGELWGLTDVVVRLEFAGWAAEDPLVLQDVLHEQEPEGVVCGLRLEVAIRVWIRTVVVGGIGLHGHDDLAAVVGAFHLVGLVLDDVECGHRQARENRDDGDDHQEFDQGETLLEFSLHGIYCVWCGL